MSNTLTKEEFLKFLKRQRHKNNRGEFYHRC